jgi:3-phosphoshikimate 1-carboxyvinyltransferase
MAQQLNKTGGKISELPDGMEITAATPLVGTEVDNKKIPLICMKLRGINCSISQI